MATSVSTTGASIAQTLGVGSGIDTGMLVEELATASRAPKEAALKLKEDANTASISGLGQASSAISGFSSALTALINGGSLFTQPNVADSSVFTATALPGSRLGSLNSLLEVRQLAQAQTLSSGYLTDVSEAVGKGKFTITRGATTTEITIDDTNSTLTGMSRAINAANAGVTASIVEDSQGARLVLKSTTGASNAFTVTIDGAAEAGLQRFAYDPQVPGGMTRDQEAKDALLKLDGVSVARSTNIITDLLPGVSLTLKTAKIDTPVSITSTRPTESIKQAVVDFVDTYNAMRATLNDLTKAANGSEKAGPLRGDYGIRALQNQLARIASTPLATGGSVSTLAEIGVSTQRDGSLSIDTARLEAVMTADPDGVEALFNPSQSSDNPLVKITSAFGKTKPGTYEVANLVPGDINNPATGDIAGMPGLGAADRLLASLTSPAAGLQIQVNGAVTKATITVDLGLGGALKQISDAITSATGPFRTATTQLEAKAEDLAEARDKMEDREDAYRERLVQQFARMNDQVSSFKATQSYLTQQIALWTKSEA